MHGRRKALNCPKVSIHPRQRVLSNFEACATPTGRSVLCNLAQLPLPIGGRALRNQKVSIGVEVARDRLSVSEAALRADRAAILPLGFENHSRSSQFVNRLPTRLLSIRLYIWLLTCIKIALPV